jgi:hypothetical protein
MALLHRADWLQYAGMDNSPTLPVKPIEAYEVFYTALHACTEQSTNVIMISTKCFVVVQNRGKLSLTML